MKKGKTSGMSTPTSASKTKGKRPVARANATLKKGNSKNDPELRAPARISRGADEEME